MTFFRALAYFAREAALNLVRSWKVSLLAILTITLSLFLAGVFLLVSGNLRRMMARWQGESKIVVYFEAGAEADAEQRLRQEIAEVPWTVRVDRVTAEAAHRRFREAFPSMADLLEGWGEDPLPVSLEVSIDWQQLERREDLAPWLRQLRADPAVTMVDDDRDWLSQLEAVVFVIEGLGTVLGAILLITAVFTISSVIRLTAYLYRDEIAVMRMVGATEFFIRGPFYMEGMLQGLAGGVLAVIALLTAHTFVLQRSSESLLASVLASKFLNTGQLMSLISLGALAGLVGAVTSLKREDLGQTAESGAENP